MNREGMRFMTRYLAGLLLGISMGLWPAVGWSDIALSMSRSVQGLDSNGFLPQDSTHIDFVVRITAQGDPAELSALAVEEQLPANLAYVSVDGDLPPDVQRFDAETGLLQFAWITLPESFPLTFRYRVNILEQTGEPIEVNGRTSYRANAGELRTPNVLTQVRLAPCLNFRRVSAEGCYTAGTQHDIEVTFSSSCEGTLTALGLADRLYSGLSFQGVSGEFAPDTTEFNDQTGDLTLRWISTPPFPFSFIYTVNVPEGLSGDLSITGHAFYTQDASARTTADQTTTLCGQDLVAPEIQLLGSDSITAECGQVFTDPGAVAQDDIDGDITQDISVIGAVNTSVPGVYPLTYTVADREGNQAIPRTRTVSVEDHTPPAMRLRGGSTVQVECHTDYVDAGASATDLCEGDLSASILATGDVDTGTPGVYERRYTVEDRFGNEAEAITRRIEVVDTLKPVISLLGASLTTVQCGGSFEDPGAIATDSCAGDLTDRLRVDGTVNTGAPGVYTLTYTVQDDAPNAALPVTRRVVVEDTTAPRLTLLGAAEVTLECGAVYNDAGATATDSCAGDLTNAIARSSNVNIAEPGRYTVTYNVSDGAGNAAPALSRIVIVRDTRLPVLRLLGNTIVNVPFGTGYADAGATATDACDGDLTSAIQVENPVNTNRVGQYTVRYRVSDGAGNAAEPITRQVNVVDAVRPTITLLGDNQPVVDCGSGPYEDTGATAADNADGDLTSAIVVRGEVDTTTPGDYLLEYTVRDSSGNESQPVVRRVTVRNTPARVTGVNILSPRTSVIIPQGREIAAVVLNSDLTLSQAIGCPEGDVEMTYAIGGQPVGSSRDRGRNFPVPVELPIGTHTLTASARTLSTNAVVVSAPLQIRIAPGTDSDANGIVDDPFAALSHEGDLWTFTALQGGCPRATQMVTWFGDCASSLERVNLTVAVPDDPTQAVSVSVPRQLVGCNQQGVLLVSIACSLQGLFNEQQAQLLLPSPPAEIAGASYFEVSLLISSDGGQTFSEVDNSLVEALPVSLSLSGLAFTSGQEATFYSHPTSVEKDATSGVRVQPVEGSWTSDGFENVSINGGILSAETHHLSTFGPFAISTEGPLLSVEEAAGGQFLVGTAQLGAAVEGVLTVRNIGTGQLIGAASIVNNPSGVFSLLGSANYNLGAGESAQIRVRFRPVEASSYSGTIRFSGDPRGETSISLRGIGTMSEKPFAFLGCGTLPGAPSQGVDWLIALGVLVTLAFMHPRRRHPGSNA